VLLGATIVCAPPSALASPADADVAVQVSFDSTAVVRLRGQRFAARQGTDLGPLNALVRRLPVARVERVLHAPEAQVDATRRELLTKGRRNVPDLNRHYRLLVSDVAQRERLLTALRALAVVDAAIAEPEPAPAPATPSFTALQRFAGPAPAGISATALAGRAGGRGQLAKIVDIEYSWNTAHEDLAAAAAPGATIANGTPSDPFADRSHGTAVLGLLVGTSNDFGVTGLAPAAGIGMVNANTTTGWRLPDAVTLAHQQLQAGDVMLLEQQVASLQPGAYVAAEYWPAVYDAIRLATQDGIIVVEAGGNGGINLDDPAYGTPFPNGMPDSGAIVVGAGTGDCATPANSRRLDSAYGSRVNVQGWGQCVVTAGYGDLFNGGADALYTQGFAGTSSASAVVAAAAALYSSIVQAEAGVAPSPLHVRRRLESTGTAQAGVDGHIGPLPDLGAATTGYDAVAPTVLLTEGPAGPTNAATPTFRFGASDPGSSFECRLAGVTPFSTCTSPHSLPALADGAYVLELRATDAAFNTGPATSRAFTVDSVAPTVAITAGPTGATTDSTPTFEFASSEPGATFECRVAESSSFAACASPYTATALADGSYTFGVRAIDAAANTGPQASRAFSVRTPPAAGGPQAVEPAPAPAPASATGSAVVGRSSGSPLLAPLIGAGTQVTARVGRGGTASLSRPRVTCRNLGLSCTVSAQARRGAGGALLGAASRVVPFGTPATVRLKLTAAARALVRRRGRLQAIVRITARDAGGTSTRTVRVTFTR
jgi:hypothetical protein